MLEGEGFFDRPFPSDDRIVDGHLDFSGFPTSGGGGLVDAYLAAGEALTGAGTSSPIYLRFTEPLDTAWIPDAAHSMTWDSPILLVDVDPTSPARGRLFPLQWSFTEGATTYQPEHLLALSPLPGFPLRPATRYALVLRPPLVGQGAWAATEDDPKYLHTWRTLAAFGVAPEEVSLVVQFTTMDPRTELAHIAETLRLRVDLPELSQELTLVEERSSYRIYQGYVLVPDWQDGERPYGEQGGGFRLDDAGRPELIRWERTRFSLTVPLGDPPADGWPIVLYSHGTGGDERAFYQSGRVDDEAYTLGREGMAVFGIAQPLHGDRATPNTNAEIHSFNYANPDAGRTNFRQGAADQIYLARLLARGGHDLGSPDGVLPLDFGRLAFFGHSQGGLVGSMAMPFVSDVVLAAGFSGAGAYLSRTIELRKDPFDIAALIEGLLDFSEGELLGALHPVVGLVQLLVEVTDPMNYAAYWYAEQPPWPARPLPIFLTEGLLDAYTPSVTTEYLAAAGRVPIVGDAATSPEALALRDLVVGALPAEENATAWSGTVTAGLAQFPDDGHFAIYDNRQARRMYTDFLKQVLVKGDPEIHD